jgi:hypothetical protein
MGENTKLYGTLRQLFANSTLSSARLGQIAALIAGAQWISNADITHSGNVISLAAGLFCRRLVWKYLQSLLARRGFNANQISDRSRIPRIARFVRTFS